MRWIYQAITQVWLLIAWAVGSTVRRFGRNARELESDHRRDGIGLFFLGLAIVFAGSIWARMDNLAGQGIYSLTSSVVGEGAFTIPVSSSRPRNSLNRTSEIAAILLNNHRRRRFIDRHSNRAS